jgi:hypothetical protein
VVNFELTGALGLFIFVIMTVPKEDLFHLWTGHRVLAFLLCLLCVMRVERR